MKLFSPFEFEVCLIGVTHVTGMGRGGLGGSQPSLNFGWGVEHLLTPPDFEKKKI